ncbi:unnamed protein product [Chrysodeixis includens]|uniref:Uncharacterized protein n=1 Tax=Chrysodeixis includens TaxID=689277 RepID=A0A9N8KRG8_CHRIL|nr:unnamed protein product [Chrysodeixis includens]
MFGCSSLRRSRYLSATAASTKWNARRCSNLSRSSSLSGMFSILAFSSPASFTQMRSISSFSSRTVAVSMSSLMIGRLSEVCANSRVMFMIMSTRRWVLLMLAGSMMIVAFVRVSRTAIPQPH